MTVIHSSVLIECPKEEAFDFASDMRNELKWNPSAQHIEKITDGPVGLGTKFIAKWKQSKEMEVECVAFDRPNSWSYHNGGPVEVTFTAHLIDEDGATRLEVDFDATPHGLFVLFFPIFMRMMRRQEAANMTSLKNSIEGARIR